jgi:outer membrane biosynthesis protein TonB
MRHIVLTLLLTLLTLTTSAEETTTSNLLNQNFDSGSWSGTADGRHGSTIIAAEHGEYIKSDDVSLKDDANLTEAQLQDGFTSNHSFKYWHWNNYNSTVKSTVTVTGADGEATTQIRTYSSTGCGSINCGSYQSGSDTLSISRSTQTDFDINVRYDFTDTSNRTGHWSVDLKEPSLTITYESEPIDQTIQDEINEIFEELEEEIFEDMEEFTFEEETFTFNEEPQFEMEMPMEMEEFTFAEEFVEEFFMEEEVFMMEDEGMTFEDGPMITFADETMMEEIYEESNEIVATFLPMVSEEEGVFNEEESFVEDDGPIFMESTEDGEGFTTETFQEEEVMEEEPSMMTETFQEEEMMEEEMPEESTEMVEEEAMEEETTEMAKEETVEEEPKKMVEATNEEEKEEVKEEKPDSKTPKKSAVQTKKLAKQKKIQQKKAIVKNLARIMDKVDKDIKDISKNLAVKNIIKMEAMTSEQASLSAYQNTMFYKPKDIYLDQLNIFDNRQIYPNTNLASYTQNDKIEIKARKLNEINIKKQRLLYELEMLKNEKS